MNTILFLIIGLIVGCVLGYFIFKSFLSKSSILKTEFDKLLSENSQLKVDIASRPSKDEIAQSYVAKESFEIINRNIETAHIELGKRDKTILELNNLLTKLQEKETYLNEKLTTFKEVCDLDFTPPF